MCVRARAALLVALVALSVLGVGNSTFQFRVAVCVGGQLARWFPEHLRDGVVRPNPSVHFSVFANIQHHTSNHPFVYNTDAHLAFHPTNLTNMPHGEVLDHISTVYSSPNSKLISVTYVPPSSAKEWTETLGFAPDRIEQYKNVQSTILNMYHHHELCMQQIRQHEALHNLSFDHVLSTREDIFYFQPVNLTSLLLMTTSEGQLGFRDCGVITKECLSWGGLHMRWQMATRNASEHFFGRRLAFYRHLYAQQRAVYNPETFERAQLDHFQLKACELVVDHIPNVVVRHVADGAVCFLKPEIIDNCVPQANMSFVWSHMCNQVPVGQRHHHWPPPRSP